MSVEMGVRQAGAAFRLALAQSYTNYGIPAATQIAERYVWEIAEVVTEVHGRERAAEMLYRVGDITAQRRGAPPIELSAPDNSVPVQKSKFNWSTVGWIAWGFLIAEVLETLVHH